MTYKPRTVITSDKAREHMVVARKLMDDMNSSMSLHQKNMFGQKKREDELLRESEMMTTKNQHEVNMQKQKLDAVNSLI